MQYLNVQQHIFPRKLDTQPPQKPSLSPDDQTSLTKVCVLTATTSRLGPGSSDMQLPKYAIPSLVQTIEPEFVYTLYIGYDSDDLYYAELERQLEMDALAYPVPIRWIKCDNLARKPGPIFNNVSTQAVAEGCDYLYRINDDTEIQGKWASEFIKVMHSFRPANIGVVGPTCHEGNTAILTHDFVHKTHHAIFGFHYPPILTDWWLDDWITLVYGKERTRKLDNIKVIHHLQQTRYTVTFSNEGKLHREVAEGAAVINQFISRLGKKVVSYSLFGNSERYTDGALANAKLMSMVYPGWVMRVYYDSTVPGSILDSLRNEAVVELVLVDSIQAPAKMAWRFLPIQDETVSAFISRDVDSRLSSRERAAVAEWENSSMPFHVMRDHPSHSNFHISGGMWGFQRRNSEVHVNISQLIDEMQSPSEYLQDMNMLNEHIWPIMQTHGVMVHDSFSCDRTATRPFPTERQKPREHVGSVFINKNSQERPDDVDILVAAQSKHSCPEESKQTACPISDVYESNIITSYTGLRDTSNYSVVWHTSNEDIPPFWDNPQTLPQTLQWIDKVRATVPSPKPGWWPSNLPFEQFPMVHNANYSEGLWCPSKSFHTEIWTFQCVVVDMGSVHPAAIGGLATKGHIISHDSRIVNPRPLLPEQQITRLSVLGVIGTYYYPDAYGHFPNEILPRLIALHERIPIEVPLLWPDTTLSIKILRELQSMGEFRGRSIIFHNTKQLLYVDLVYAYTFAEDTAYRHNFAAATVPELRNTRAMFRRAITTHAFKKRKTSIVFWNREEGSARSISNMQEVQESLSEFEKDLTYFIPSRSAASGKGFFEQAAILQSTKVFISPHGAGMSNVLFLTEGAVAVEIVYSDAEFRCPEEYYCLCRAIGVKYYMTAASGSHGTQLTVLFPDELRQIIVMNMNNATL